jgi:hypothetical protein
MVPRGRSKLTPSDIEGNYVICDPQQIHIHETGFYSYNNMRTLLQYSSLELASQLRTNQIVTWLSDYIQGLDW